MKILVDDPIEGPWLKQIFAWYAKSKQATEIARLLNEKGVKPRYCDRWNMSVVYSLLRVNGVHKSRSAGSPFTYDREKAYKLALALRQDGAKLHTLAEALTRAKLRPKNAQRYAVSSVQDLLRGSILYNPNTAQGLALHLKETGHSLRDICDKLLAQGFTAPRGGRWYPKTVADLMKRDDGGGMQGQGGRGSFESWGDDRGSAQDRALASTAPLRGAVAGGGKDKAMAAAVLRLLAIVASPGSCRTMTGLRPPLISAAASPHGIASQLSEDDGATSTASVRRLALTASSASCRRMTGPRVRRSAAAAGLSSPAGQSVARIETGHTLSPLPCCAHGSKVALSCAQHTQVHRPGSTPHTA